MQQHQRHSGTLTVLHLAQPIDGGVARVVTDLVRAQTRAGLRTLVACPPGGLSEGAYAAGAEVLRWAASREPGPGLPRETAEAARLVRRSAPDVVHLHSAKAGLAGRLALRGGVPTVFQPHAWSFEAVKGVTARAALHWERYAARWADRVLCVSEDERQQGERAGISARWAVVHNGVDTARFRPAEPGETRRARARVAARAELPGGAPLVVCMGRLCRQKGQDVLLRAWPAVTSVVPEAHLAVVGDGPARAALQASAPEQVFFPGPTSDPASWYAAADLVVLPSRWEGMALAPLEAMSRGRPVVLSDVSGARESLPAGHAAACLVPPDDPRALATAVTRLLGDGPLREALGRQAQRHVRGTRDVRDTAAAVDDLYRVLLGLPHHDREDLISR